MNYNPEIYYKIYMFIANMILNKDFRWELSIDLSDDEKVDIFWSDCNNGITVDIYKPSIEENIDWGWLISMEDVYYSIEDENGIFFEYETPESEKPNEVTEERMKELLDIIKAKADFAYELSFTR